MLDFAKNYSLKKLKEAVQAGELDKVKWILKYLSPRLENKSSLLSEAINYPAIVQELLQAYPAEPPLGFTQSEKKNAFILASVCQAHETVSIFLTVCNQAIDEETIKNALQIAIGADDDALIKILIKKRSAALSAKVRGEVLLLAMENSSLRAFVALLEDPLILSALLKVVRNVNLEILKKTLLRANQEIRSAIKQELLLIAIQSRNLDLFTALITHLSIAELLNKKHYEILISPKKDEFDPVKQEMFNQLIKFPMFKFFDAITHHRHAALPALIDEIHEKMNDELLQEVLEVNLQEENAAAIESLRIILNYFNSKIQHKKELFKMAYTKGFFLMAEVLFEFWQQELNIEDKKAAFIYAVNTGSLPLFNLLLSDDDFGREGIFLFVIGLQTRLPPVIPQSTEQTMIARLLKVPAVAFLNAAAKGDAETLSEILNKKAAQISSATKGKALVLAAQSNHPGIIQILLKQCVEQISRKDKKSALKKAVGNYAADGVKMLVSHPRIAALTAYKENKLLKLALKKLETARERSQYVEQAGVIKDTLIYLPNVLLIEKIAANANDFTDFIDRYSDHISSVDMGKALKFIITLQHNNKFTHGNMLKLLISRFSSKISAHYKSRALIKAAEAGNIPAVEILLSEPSIREVAHFNDNEALYKAANKQIEKMLFDIVVVYFFNLIMQGDTKEINDIFNSIEHHISDDQLGYALFIAANRGDVDTVEFLLKDNYRTINNDYKHAALVYACQNSHYKTVKCLLTDEAVLATADRDGNEALTRAQRRKVETTDLSEKLRLEKIINKLMHIKSVAKQAGDAELQKGSLAQRAQSPENSSTPLTSSQRAIGFTLKEHYKAVYQAKGGWPAIFEDIKTYLAQLYEKEPAVDENNKPLPLYYSPNLSKFALEAYYKHRIHAAWRYLSSPNPWIHENAISQSVDGGKAAIIPEPLKELLAYLWIALNDDRLVDGDVEDNERLEGNKIKLAEGFTVEGNRYAFGENLGHQGRSHNWDETRPVLNENKEPIKDYLGRIVTEHYDDLGPDKPTCSDGVGQRLYEVPYGHPYIIEPESRALDQEIFRNFMIAHLVNPSSNQSGTIIDRLEKLPIERIKIIKHASREYLMTLDEDTSYLEDPFIKNAFTFSNAQMHAFIKLSKLWYGAERIEPRYVSIAYRFAENPIAAFAARLKDYATSRLKKEKEARLEMLSQKMVNLDNKEQEEKSNLLFTPAYNRYRTPSILNVARQVGSLSLTAVSSRKIKNSRSLLPGDC